jgi:hypothetical protein
MKTDVVEVLGDLVVRTQQAKLSIVRVNLPEALRPLMAAGRFVSLAGGARWVAQWDDDEVSAICLRLQLNCLPGRVVVVRFALPQCARTLACHPGQVVLVDGEGFAEFGHSRTLQRGIILPVATTAMLSELLQPTGASSRESS